MKSVKKKKKKAKRKSYKFRYGEAAKIEYREKEDLIRALRELASRGELVGPTANMFSRQAGFAEYKAVRVHMLGQDMTDGEIRDIMDEIERVVREEKLKPGYMKKEEQRDVDKNQEDSDFRQEVAQAEVEDAELETGDGTGSED